MSRLSKFLNSVMQDVRFGLRTFKEAPIFAVAAVLTLTLGIAANTAIFSVTNSVLLNSRPFRTIQHPERVVMIWERAPRMGSFFADGFPVRLTDFRNWKDAGLSFEDIAVWHDINVNLTDAQVRKNKPERITAGQASASLLPMFHAPLQRGRYFRAEENKPGSDRVAIITDSLYRSRFGGDPQILGKPVRADGADYTIVGVLAKDFALPAMMGGFDQKNVSLWLPMDTTQKGDASKLNNCYVYARLKPGVSIGRATAELQSIQTRLARTDDQLKFFSGIKVSSIFNEDVGGDLKQSLWVLQAAVGLVLLIACANVASLLLTRAVGREKEVAIRVALGAGPMRVLRQMLTESLLLSSAAGLLGGLLAYQMLQAVNYLAPKDTHGLHEMRLDGTVLLFTVAVSVIAGLLFGIAPFLQTRKQDIHETLSRSSRTVSGGSSGMRRWLTVTELALSVTLLIGAGLMIRTLWTLMSTDLGFERGHLLSMHMSLPDDRYKTPDSAKAFNESLLREVGDTAGIQSAMMTTAIPMQSVQKSSFEIKGQKHKPENMPVATWARVSARYFETLNTRVLRGRTFEGTDATSGPAGVAVVNRAFAQENGGEDAILGRVIEFGGEDGKPGEYRIVGVVANERQMGPDRPTSAEFFLPGRALSSFYLLMRTSGDPTAVAHAVEQKIWGLDANLPVGEVRSMDTVLNEWTAPRRFMMSILVAFAVLALMLAGVGLYSVLAYGVTLRTREIGIRVALGAEPGQVARAVLFDGCRLTAAGVITGLVLAASLSRFMQSLIYGVQAMDPLTFVAVPLLLTAIALLASYLPARRAARVDPTVALRAE